MAWSRDPALKKAASDEEYAQNEKKLRDERASGKITEAELTHARALLRFDEDERLKESSFEVRVRLVSDGPSSFFSPPEHGRWGRALAREDGRGQGPVEEGAPTRRRFPTKTTCWNRGRMIRLLIGLALSSQFGPRGRGRGPKLSAALPPPSLPPLSLFWRAFPGPPSSGAFFLRFMVVGDSGPASWAGAAGRKLYVFGHELTHALAAWSVGAKVLGFKSARTGATSTCRTSNAFIALAPYCVPIYTLVVVGAYRLLCGPSPAWNAAGFSRRDGRDGGVSFAQDRRKSFGPAAARPGRGRRRDFLAVVDRVANGVLVLLLLKTLFPSAVPLSRTACAAWRYGSAGFWRWSYRFLRPIPAAFTAQLRRK